LLIRKIALLLIHLYSVDGILLNYEHLFSLLPENRSVAANHKRILVEQLQMFLVLNPAYFIPNDLILIFVLAVASVVEVVIEKGHLKIGSWKVAQ